MKTSSSVWCFVPFFVVLVFVLILLPHGSQHQHHGRRNQILSQLSSKAILVEGWLRDKQSTTDAEPASSSSSSSSTEYYYYYMSGSGSGNGIPLSPNLSTCHPTSSQIPDSPHKTSHEVNCCPASPDSGEPIIRDFQFPSPSSASPVRIRRPAHRLALDTEYLAKYNKAVAIMKRLPPDHPHSWHRQSQIHCIYCNGAYYQAGAAADVPFMIHESWLFFPFHRFYVYFHERILGKLIGDDTFALPYWNYDSPDGMPIPDIYMKGELHDMKRATRHLPPAPVAIDYTPDKLDLVDEPPAAEQTATNLALLYQHMVSGASKPELFMGCKLRPGDGACSGMGTVEAAPHNSVHLWVGNASTPEYEDMGTLYAAARDPVFFAHHANLDRLWAVWRRLRGYHGSRPEFDDPQWLDSHFYFHDENADLVRVRVRDAIDMDRLGYAYEEVDLPWLDARPKPSVAPELARDLLHAKEKDYNNILRMATNKGPWTLEGTVRVQVARPHKSTIKAGQEEFEEEVLVVEGISVEKGMHAKFDIYVNLAVDETAASPKLREYAGCFVKMKGADVAMKGGSIRNMKVGISEILEDLEAGEDDSIWVSLVPRGGTGNATRVDGIRIDTCNDS
ncbi:polyphenol oxidase, chloroplastic [Iris pallida]|uniref:Polyphenol oxidase, chloroplastic n=1 Tax=Iris pallida TaxID=29817 RepID=A0AAX6IB95_IRIPA|nr:polyphenol oxidase, chloroplastic [Iris pallida]